MRQGCRRGRNFELASRGGRCESRLRRCGRRRGRGGSRCRFRCRYRGRSDRSRRSRSGCRRRSRGSTRSLELQHDAALGDFVADLDVNGLHHAGRRRGNFHRGLVGFDSDEALLGSDGVAWFDKNFDDLNGIEVSDVRNKDGGHVAHVVCLPQACAGLILFGLMAYFLIASATLAAGTAPSSARARRVASTTKWRSISKCSRSL